MKPTCTIINDIEFEINSDFRTAVKCNNVLTDVEIGNHEKSLAIIYLIFGEKGLNHGDIYQELLDKALLFLTCGRGFKDKKGEADMDYEQDMSFIEASFMLDYNIDLENNNMHYWKFNELLSGLSEDAILSRVRYIRNYDLSEIKGAKYKKQMIEQKEAVALKKKKIRATTQQQKNSNAFFEAIERK